MTIIQNGQQIMRDTGLADWDTLSPAARSAAVKREALALGADFVGIGNIERWQGAPQQMDPRQIMPECQSVICLGFRVMRGSLRGIEEGTLFSNYAAMGYGGITHLYMPVVVMNLCKHIEDHGSEAIPIGQIDNWRAITNTGWLKKNYSRPVAPGRAAPDVMVHTRIAAFLCGCGEIGMSKMFLSPDFGPRNRCGIILTDAALAPDPLYAGPALCNKCGACARECPGKCFDKDKIVKVTLAGRDVEWWDVDCYKCDVYFRGGAWSDESVAEPDQYMPNPYSTLPPPHNSDIMRGSHTPFMKKPANLFETGQAVCGARGCTRACMISLEARGVLHNAFKQQFRRRKPWVVDWSAPPLPTEQPATDWHPDAEVD